jgi:hypothetical protein
MKRILSFSRKQAISNNPKKANKYLSCILVINIQKASKEIADVKKR